MNLLQRALIEKVGHDNGFEHVLPAATEGWMALGSARHPVEVLVQVAPGGLAGKLSRCQPSLPGELARSFPQTAQGNDPLGMTFILPTEAALAGWMRRAASLAQALPDQAMTAFDAQVQTALADMEPDTAKNTEVQRLVRQRVGQQARHLLAPLGFDQGHARFIAGGFNPQNQQTHARECRACPMGTRAQPVQRPPLM